jgi:hypothetical protein
MLKRHRSVILYLRGGSAYLRALLTAERLAPQTA